MFRLFFVESQDGALKKGHAPKRKGKQRGYKVTYVIIKRQ